MEPNTYTFGCVAVEENGGEEDIDPLQAPSSVPDCGYLVHAEAEGANRPTTLRYDLMPVQIFHSGQSTNMNLRAFQRVAYSAATSLRVCT